MERRILLIDFEQRSLQATSALLERAGYTVFAARTGKEADRALVETSPDLVILEPMIPGQDGFRLISTIKRRRHEHKTHVIVASRIFRGPRYRAMSREAGADAYLERPQQDGMLLPTVEKLLPAPVRATSPGPDQAHPAEASGEASSVPEAPPSRPYSASMTSAPVSMPVAATASAPASAAVLETEAAAAPATVEALAPAPPPALAIETPFLSAISDSDIDDALSRVLGPDAAPLLPDLTGLEPGMILAEPPLRNLRAEAAVGVLEAPAPTMEAAPPPAPETLAPSAVAAPVSDAQATPESQPVAEVLAPPAAIPAASEAGAALPPVTGEQGGAPPAEQTEVETVLPRDLAAALDRLELSDEVTGDATMAPAPVIFDETQEDLDALTAGLTAEVADSTDFDILPESGSEFSLANAPIAETPTPPPADPAPAVFAAEEAARAAATPVIESESPLQQMARELDQEIELTPPVAPEAAPPAPEPSGPEPSGPEPSGPAPSAPAPASAPPVEQDLEAELERAFLGFSCGPDDAPPEIPPAKAAGVKDEQEAQASGGVEERRDEAAEVAEKPIPEGLRGMDAGTADLLSSLEELANSLPDDNEGPPGDTGWTGATGFGAPTDAPLDEPPPAAAAVAPAPPSAGEQREERLVSNEQGIEPVVDPMFSTGHGGLEIEPLAGPLYGEQSGAAPRSPRAEAPSRAPRTSEMAGPVVGSRASKVAGWILGLLAIIVVVAGIVAGVRYFRGAKQTEQAAPAATEDSAATTAPPATSEHIAPPLGRRPSAAMPAKDRPPTPVLGDAQNNAPRVDRRPMGATEAPTTKPPRSSPATNATGNPKSEAAPAPEAPGTVPPSTGVSSRPGPAPASQVRPANQVSAVTAPAGEETQPAEGPALRRTPSPAALTPTERTESPVEAPPPPATAGPVVRIGELDEPLHLISAPAPALPADAREAGASGRVFLSVLVGEDGAVREARILVEPGHGLGAAAREAVLSWRYTPPRRAGEAVRVWKTEVVEFKATDGER